MDRSSKPKIMKETLDLNHTLDQMNLRHTQNISSKKQHNTCSSSVHMEHSQFLFGEIKKVPELNSGCCCTTLLIYLIPLNCTL